MYFSELMAKMQLSWSLEILENASLRFPRAKVDETVDFMLYPSSADSSVNLILK